MMYVNTVPWHGLGVHLPKLAIASEANEAAQMDYTVEKRSLQALVSRKIKTPVRDHFATVRMDTGAVLGVVGSRYSVIQNRDAFGFFDALVGEDEAVYETAGVLGNGEKIWILAKLPGYIKVRGMDVIDKYLLLTNSHDSSSLVRDKLTPIRVVCSNTLSVALSGSEEEVRIRHTPSGIDNLREAHKLLGLTNQLYEQLDFIFNRMALRKLTDKQLLQYVKTLIPENEEAEFKTRTDNIRSKILELHEVGAGAHMSRGSLWGAFNAVSEYTDHVQHSASPEKRLKSVWYGSGERLKQKAFALAQGMLNSHHSYIHQGRCFRWESIGFFNMEEMV
jgi:phage/plasmid-like protein (TIGR03299 family)